MLFSSFEVFEYCCQFWTGILPSSRHSTLPRNVNRTLLALLPINQLDSLCNYCTIHYSSNNFKDSQLKVAESNPVQTAAICT